MLESQRISDHRFQYWWNQCAHMSFWLLHIGVLSAIIGLTMFFNSILYIGHRGFLLSTLILLTLLSYENIIENVLPKILLKPFQRTVVAFASKFPYCYISYYAGMVFQICIPDQIRLKMRGCRQKIKNSIYSGFLWVVLRFQLWPLWNFP